MKYTGLIFFLLIIAVPLGHAQDSDQWFSEGNALYQEGAFVEALTRYQHILDQGLESGALHFNIGNCYYKLQDTGMAILFYERAERLIPGDEALEANLALANLAVIDQIEAQSEFILFRIIRSIVHFIPRSILVWIVLILYLLLMIFFILWLLARSRTLRVLGSRGSISFAVLFVLFGMCLLGQVRDRNNNIEAIILADRVDVKSAPTEDSMDVFSLHEGTKVNIDQSTEEWVEIILPDRNVGWVKREVLEAI